MSAECTSSISQPSDSSAPAARGTKTASLTLAPAPKERARSFPVSKSCRSNLVSVPRCRLTSRPPPHSRTVGQPNAALVDPGNSCPRSSSRSSLTAPPWPSRCQRSSVGTPRSGRGLRAEHGGVAHHVDHDAIAVRLVEGVHRVEHVARLDVVPDDLGRLAVAGQQADAGLVALLPAVRERRTRRGGVQAERHGEIEQDDGALRDGAVVHAHRSAHGDAPAGPHLAVARRGSSPRRRCPTRRSTRRRRAHPSAGRAWGAPCSRPAACRRSRTGRSSRARCSARRGVPPPRRWRTYGRHDRSHSCWARSPCRRARPRAGLLAERARHLRRAHPAVAVPLGPAVPQPDPVHHPVAGEPVVARRARGARRDWGRCEGTGRSGPRAPARSPGARSPSPPRAPARNCPPGTDWSVTVTNYPLRRARTAFPR